MTGRDFEHINEERTLKEGGRDSEWITDGI